MKMQPVEWKKMFAKLLFIYLLLVVLCAGFLQLQPVGATLCCIARASSYGGFSYCRAQVLGTQALEAAACRLANCSLQTLEHELGSCGTWVHVMWHLSKPGITPMTPALVGRFLYNAPPGKS